MSDSASCKESALDLVSKAVANQDAALTTRDHAMLAARRAGFTWREVAAAASMTEHGARLAIARRFGPQAMYASGSSTHQPGER
ncbi:MAG: hypothetical protein ACK5MP_09250 [Nostocoides sp.]